MTIQEQLERAGITYPIPSDTDFFRLDLSPIKLPLIIIAGIQALYEGTFANVDSHPDKIPVAAAVAVTDVGVIVSAASTLPRKVGVYNNGAKDLILIEGNSIPGFDGQDALGDDFGVVLAAGDYYESPVAHRGPVRARARTGETTSTTVTGY